MAIDFLGQELKIGDTVVYTHHTPTSSFMVKGVIVGIVQKNTAGGMGYKVDIDVSSVNRDKPIRVWPDKVIKYDAERMRVDV